MSILMRGAGPAQGVGKKSARMLDVGLGLFIFLLS